MFSLAALALLITPVMTTVYHFRYVIAPLPLIGPSGALGMVALRDRLRIWRSTGSDEPPCDGAEPLERDGKESQAVAPHR
jgi:hypothetical protein